MNKKLYRNVETRVMAGVCAGVAEYFNIDPTIVRVIWALVSVFGPGLLAYLVCALVMPKKSDIYPHM